MKKNIIIARIAEGLGNQLFMFANAYAIAKSKKYSLMLDDESGYFKNKNKKTHFKNLLKYYLVNKLSFAILCLLILILRPVMSILNQRP